MSELVRVGQIVGAFGIKGQVKVVPLTSFAERFDPGRRLRANDEWLTVKEAADHSGQLTLTFVEVADRTRAESLQWAYLEAFASERPELGEDEYLTADLIGLDVIVEGGSIGIVREVLAAPAQDVLVVALTAGGDDLLIPAVKQFVKEVDLKSRKIAVELLPGMLSE